MWIETYLTGYYAALNAQPRSDNPYMRKSRKYWGWCRGYLDGVIEAQKDEGKIV